MLTGDCVLPRITPNVNLNPQTEPDPLGDYLRSLEKLGRLRRDEALPAHEWRFVGHRARLLEIRAHHEQRFLEVIDGDARRLRHRVGDRAAHGLVAPVGPDRRVHAPLRDRRGLRAPARARPGVACSRSPRASRRAGSSSRRERERRATHRCCARWPTAIATVILNRPERMNAWTHAMEVAYFDLIDALDDDPAVRVVVLTGAGRGFCPGLDAGDLAARTQGVAGKEGVDRPMTYARTLRKPLLAAINGGCAGIGLVQALVADLRFAAAGAKLATAFTRRGLVAEFGASWMLPRLVGAGNAMDLLLSGRAVHRRGGARHGPGEPRVPRRRAARRDAGVRA